MKPATIEFVGNMKTEGVGRDSKFLKLMFDFVWFELILYQIGRFPGIELGYNVSLKNTAYCLCWDSNQGALEFKTGLLRYEIKESTLLVVYFHIMLGKGYKNVELENISGC